MVMWAFAEYTNKASIDSIESISYAIPYTMIYGAMRCEKHRQASTAERR